MTPKEKEFVEWVKSECKKNNIKCSLRNVTYLKLSPKIRCSGYFYEDGETAQLVCATNRNQFVTTLAHEYCHATQWLDNIDLWEKSGDSLNKLEEWLSGKRIKNIKKHLAISRELELDNEKRTVKLLKKWDLDIDLKEYIRRANAYVLFYNYLGISRRWCSPYNSPYRNEKLLSVMSDKFDMNYEYLDDHIKKVFIEQKI